jgi:hypothetical protein
MEMFPETFFELIPQMVVPAGIVQGQLMAVDPDQARSQLCTPLNSSNEHEDADALPSLLPLLC